MWLRMQAANDLLDAEQEVDTSNIPTLKSAWTCSRTGPWSTASTTGLRFLATVPPPA
jgi:hypothetical protein